MAPKRSIDRLLFVFNADTGSFNAFLASLNRLALPQAAQA